MSNNDKQFHKAVEKGLVDPEMDPIEFDNWLELDENLEDLNSKKKDDDDKRLAGVKSAKKEGYTHTNKAKV